MDPGDGSEVQNKTGLDTTGTISSNEQEVIGMLLAQTTQGTTEAGQLAQHVVSVQVRKRQGIGSSLELAQFPVTPLGGLQTRARQTFSWLSLATSEGDCPLWTRASSRPNLEAWNIHKKFV